MKSSTVLLLATSLAMFAKNPKIAADLAINGTEEDVIVVFKSASNQGHHDLVNRHRGRLMRELPLLNAAHYRVPAREMEALAANPDVESIHPDRQVQSTSFSGNVDYSWMSLLNLSSNSSVPAYNGMGVGVAVIDSGFRTGVDLFRGPIYSQSFVGTEDVTDWFGHGEHVVGILAGSGSSSTGSQFYYTVRGIAPRVNLIDLKALDRNGSGTDSSVIAAIDRAIALKSSYNIRVINLSLGRPVTVSYKNDLLCQAVERAWKAGIVVVVAAGNQGRNDSAGTKGYGTITAPGNDPYVITVGAMNTKGTLTRSDDVMTSFSSKGPTVIDLVVKPDLVAPGSNIASNRPKSTWFDLQYATNRVPSSAYCATCNYTADNLNYFQMSGTSMAAPFVSGAAALLLQQNPNLTPDQVKARLMKTASKTFAPATVVNDPQTGANYTVNGDIFTVGAGYLDINSALNNADVAPATLAATSPTVSYNSSIGSFQLVTGSGVVWGTGIVWGTGVVWGTNVLSGAGIVWGSGVVWGTGIVWGTTSPWTSSTSFTEALGILVNGEN